MKIEEIFDNKDKKDFLDLVEVIREARKDMTNFKEPTRKEVQEKSPFNTLLREYYLMKIKFMQIKDNYNSEVAKKAFNEKITEFIEKQPGYKEALEYVLYEEKEAQKEEQDFTNDEETQEEAI